MNELENDYKVFVETNKKFDLITAAREKSGELADPSTSAANGLWLSKDVLKNWKRIAKSNIEDDFKSCSESISTVDGDAETQEDDSDISSLPFNTELICSHSMYLVLYFTCPNNYNNLLYFVYIIFLQTI